MHDSGLPPLHGLADQPGWNPNEGFTNREANLISYNAMVRWGDRFRHHTAPQQQGNGGGCNPVEKLLIETVGELAGESDKMANAINTLMDRQDHLEGEYVNQISILLKQVQTLTQEVERLRHQSQRPAHARPAKTPQTWTGWRPRGGGANGLPFPGSGFNRPHPKRR